MPIAEPIQLAGRYRMFFYKLHHMESYRRIESGIQRDLPAGTKAMVDNLEAELQRGELSEANQR